MPKPPKHPKHHYIPIFYLKQWAGVDGRVCEFSRPFREVVPRMTHPSGTGYECGLYSFDLPSSAAAEHMERRFFDRVDHLASEALQLLLTDRISDLDGMTKSAWSRFIMTLSPQRLRLSLRTSGHSPTSVFRTPVGHNEEPPGEMAGRCCYLVDNVFVFGCGGRI